VLKKALLTGATGFIGSSLYIALRKAGYKVCVLGRVKPVDEEVEFYHWEMTDALPLDALQGVDTVFHLAAKAHALSSGWQDEECYFPVNIAATRRLLEAAKATDVQRFVYFSSVKATAEPGCEGVDELDQTLPESMYGRSKRMAEQLVLSGGFVSEPVVLRPTMVYGLTRKGNLPRMMRAISKGYFPLFPDVKNKRSMIHVADVVRAALLAATKREAIGNIYILSDGRGYDIREIHQWVCKALDQPMPAHALPMWLVSSMGLAGDVIGRLRGKSFMFDSDVLGKLIGSAMYDSKKIEHELGFSAQRHLEESIPEILGYVRRGK